MQKKLFVGLIKSRRGIIGVSILGFLLSLTAIAVLVIPFDSYRLWNDPDYWINNPKTAAPSWTNYFGSKEFEHVSLDKNNAKTNSEVSEGIRVDNFGFDINIQADDFPDDFMFLHSLKYGEIPPVLQIDITRPDNNTFTVYYSSLPTTNSLNNTFTDRIFSTNNNIKESLSQYQNLFNFPISGFEPQVLLFSDTNKPQVLQGTYHISQRFFLFDNSSSIEDVGIILGGKVYGIMGTDDLRRDLFVGIIWGIPIALFIGLTVSIFGISIGLIYGVVSGYRAKKTDEVMMRINDIFYAFPTLILLILLSITFGRSIIL
ncbi:MAG TPA: ABC transporter permease, partial [Nitrososphaeraceae archaeon]|nr:ABC transporter permease [Nitrososphaeraceae archaeon]